MSDEIISLANVPLGRLVGELLRRQRQQSPEVRVGHAIAASAGELGAVVVIRGSQTINQVLPFIESVSAAAAASENLPGAAAPAAGRLCLN